MRYFPTGANGIASGNIAQLLSLSLSRAAGEGSRARRARKTLRPWSEMDHDDAAKRCTRGGHRRRCALSPALFFGAFAGTAEWTGATGMAWDVHQSATAR